MSEIESKLTMLLQEGGWLLTAPEVGKLVSLLRQAGLVIIENRQWEEMQQAIQEHEEADAFLHQVLTRAENYWREQTGRQDSFPTLGALIAFLVGLVEQNGVSNISKHQA